MLACAFAAGLPYAVGRLLRVGSRVDGLPLSPVLKRARAVLNDEVCVAGRFSALTFGPDASVKRADVDQVVNALADFCPCGELAECTSRRRPCGELLH